VGQAKACARLYAIRDRKQFKTRNFLFIQDLQTMQMDIFVEFRLIFVSIR